MKKYLLLFVLAFSLIGLGDAATKFKIPKDEQGNLDAGLRVAGVNVVQLVTSTNPALASDNAGTTFTEGYIYWVILASTDTLPATGLYLELRSSATANVTSARLVPRISAIENLAGNSTESQIVTFDPPVPFNNGLSVNLGPVGDNVHASDNFEYGVGIRWKREQ